ncbi:MAG: carboxypeptidase regulatory-like domain-containing protein, partial [Planctomycetes bacterium]|nr:carboxypeptidase regulatory-like domain-containing protein [Planctomycetota bacterium]
PHPNGECTIRAAGGSDAVEVAAPGFQTLRANVAPLDNGIQILRLKPGWTGSGRVVRAGNPVEGAMVTLSGKSRGTRRATTDAQGRFEVSSLGDSEYSVTATLPGAQSETKNLTLKEPNCGDLVLKDLGEVLGTVLCPDFVQPQEVRLRMGIFRDIPIDAEGHFHVHNVPAGLHRISVGRIEGKLDPAAWRYQRNTPQVELSPGEVAEITLDLNELAVGSIRLRLLAGGEPVPDFSIMLGSTQGVVRSSRSLGTTDANGVAIGSFPPGAYQLFTGSEFLDLDGEMITCIAGQRTETLIDFPVGHLSIQLPADWPLPETGSVNLRLTNQAAGAKDLFNMRRTLYWKDGALFEGLNTRKALEFDPETRRIECPAMPLGTYEVKLSSHAGKIIVGGPLGNSKSAVYQGGETLHSTLGTVTVA